MHYPVIIAATHVPELKKVEYTETGISFGASVTLATFEETMKDAMKTLPGEQHVVLRKQIFIALLSYFCRSFYDFVTI